MPKKAYQMAGTDVSKQVNRRWFQTARTMGKEEAPV
jgi:hypothetical protein